ncbi:MAG: cadherin domain-containing protein [Bacteroidota bacterium]
MSARTRFVLYISIFFAFILFEREASAQENPIFLDQSVNIIDTVESGDLIIELEATDPQGDELSFNVLSGNDDDAFFLDEFTGIITLADRLALDFSIPKIRALTIEASDGSNATEATISILLNTKPLFSWQASAFSRAEEDVWSIEVPVADGENDQLEVTITEGNGDNLLAIVSTVVSEVQVFEITPTDQQGGIDFESGINQFDLTLRAEDEFSNVSMSQISISITNINDNPPMLTDAFLTIDEDLPQGTVITTATATDPDGDELLYFLVAGNTADAFAIDALTGQLAVADQSAIDFETNPEFSLVIAAFDGQNQSEAIYTIALLQSPTPIIENQTFFINNTLNDGDIIGQVVASDPQFDELTFSITGGPDAALFTIGEFSGALSITNVSSLDFSEPTNFSTEITVSDGVESASATVLLTLNLPPKFAFTTTTFSFPENEKWSLEVPVSDPESQDLQVLFTAGNENEIFLLEQGVSTPSSFYISPRDTIDYETDARFYTLSIQATDDLGSFSAVENIEIMVANVNDNAPVAEAITIDIEEEIPNGTQITTVLATDLDGDVLSYSILGGNVDSAFSLSENGGEISVSNSSALIFDLNPTFNLTVGISDGLFNTVIIVSINVNQALVNSPPIVENQAFSIPEDSKDRDFVGKILANDPEQMLLNYAISEGNDSGTFLLNGTSGELFVERGELLDFESLAVYNLLVSVSDGELSSTAQITINITDVDENTPLHTPERNTFSVSPNPAKSAIRITGKPNSITIFSLSGQLVQKLNTQGSDIYDVGDLASGTYLFWIQDDYEKTMQRVVIKD